MKNDDRLDYYYYRSKIEGYRSRAAYKLKEINEKFKIIKRGYVVVDLGAAPGGWIQVAREIVGDKGFIVGVDINPIAKFPWENVKTIIADITDPNTVDKVKSLLPNKVANVVLSDAAPKLSGIHEIDHANQIFLAENALQISLKLLVEDGACVIKALQGSTFREFINKVRENFKYVKIYKPKASRKKSSEIYVIAKMRISQHHI
ncbi:MAG: RlmE family RNA methyltransferase [Candidatus Methanomethylicia archaeon]|nr:RlmE family RNA methyltransferase [Candidatus Methanomethylicia archaeon]MCX8169218.1 RlmE family RNA methyltransferase [Candidatus Methanomethylicia archaeon]MDW7989000.1 RlmE family RNA methyltransferase [Nitrososphaerota archaeon]